MYIQTLVEMYGSDGAEERFIFIFSRRTKNIVDSHTIAIAEYLDLLVKDEASRACKNLTIHEKALLYETLRSKGKPASQKPK